MTNTPAPMPLAVAAGLLFPHGGVTKATLLAEIRKGRLGFEKIGNRYMVTEADVEAWRKQCRERKSPPVSGSGRATIAPPNSSFSTTAESTAMAEMLGKNGAARGNRTLDLSLTKGVAARQLADFPWISGCDVLQSFIVGSRQSWAKHGRKRAKPIKGFRATRITGWLA